MKFRCIKNVIGMDNLVIQSHKRARNRVTLNIK